MQIQVCLLLLSVGVYASYADSLESTTEDDLFSQLDFIFPADFLSKFPGESEFFSVKILGYLFFSMFAKYLGKNEPIKFWSKFNRNDFNRVAIDAVFYEYLTKFAGKKMKPLIYDPLESSSSSAETIAIDRIGGYLDKLSTAEVPADQFETTSQATEIHDGKHENVGTSEASLCGIPGIDFPNYSDIPKTSFSCANKLVPGIYADTETGCQVFHTCWPHRIDSFLCPLGTTFNQALLTCDIWHESDCSSSPLLFHHSPFAKGKIPRNTEPSIILDDETLANTETPFATELDIPEYDGTCQSLINEPLQMHMKFVPTKCKVTDLISGIEVKMNCTTPKVELDVVEIVTESPLKEEYVDTTSEEQLHPSTTELPSDNQKFPQRMNYGFIEESVFKSTSHGKTRHFHSVRKSTHLKPSKPSEETIKQMFNSMITTLELSNKILNEGLLPLVEQIVLDSRRKKSKS